MIVGLELGQGKVLQLYFFRVQGNQGLNLESLDYFALPVLHGGVDRFTKEEMPVASWATFEA
jgi:hypothetical protein